MKDVFEGKDILVTGGCGSIGSEIVKQLLKYNPKKIRVMDNNESNLFYLGQELNTDKVRLLIGDVRDRNRVYRAMKGVDIVFHAAALKHVPLCEYNPFEAVSTNVIGTENLISAAIDSNVEKFIGISTHKAINPINTMGATKLLSEKIIIDTALSQIDTKFCCVRFGNVLDSVGKIDRFLLPNDFEATCNKITEFLLRHHFVYPSNRLRNDFLEMQSSYRCFDDLYWRFS